MLQFSIRGLCRISPNFPVRSFVTNSVNCARNRPNWKYLSKETEDRTKHILIDRRSLENISTPPTYIQNISDIFDFFPLSPDKVEKTLLDHPELLEFNSSDVIDVIKIFVEAGDYDIITQEEALLSIARFPDLLKINKDKFKENISNIFGLTSLYDIPWNVVMVASPLTLTFDPSDIGFIVDNLNNYFSDDRIRDVIGNNPNLFEMPWDEIEEKIKYLQYTMHVSAYRIAMTPKSLTHSLDFFKLRYEFLSRAGHYRHPDPGAKSAVPAEASPALHLLTDTDDDRFVFKCCPGLTLEEFNVFRSVMMLEELGDDLLNDVPEDDDDNEELEGDRNRYTVPTKSREKIKYDPDRFRK